MLAVVAAALAAVATVHAGDGKEQIRFNAADQAAARAVVIRRADLGSGWAGGPAKPDLSAGPSCPDYHPKVSDLVLTGAARTTFQRSGFEFDSQSGVLKTRRMVALDWRRSVLAPGVVPCLRRTIGSGLGPNAKVVSFKKLPFPKLATYNALFRGVISVQAQGKTVRVLTDLVLVGRSRTELTLTVVGPASAKVAISAAERRLARVLITGARAARPCRGRASANPVGSLATPLLIVVFAAAAGVTWIAGVALSKTTDALDVRLGFGEELGGIILLAVAGSLPELAITISAASSGHLGLAAGNLIGGIAVQTMVLVVCDAVAGPRNSLTFLAGALTPVLEALLVVLVVSGVLMGALLRPSIAIGGVVSPASLAIVALWVTGVYVIDRARKEKRWTVTMPGSRRGRLSHREPMPAKPHPYAGSSTVRVAAIFGAACAITLAAGVALEVTGNTLADRAGINGVIFGATVLAAATALPEISSGVAAVRLGDNALALGDIFGGNAFQVCLFLVADLIAGSPVLPSAGGLNSWVASLGVALTAIYAMGIIVRRQRCFLRLGADSWVAIVVFGLGIAGLIALAY